MENIFSSKHELISRKEKERLLNQRGICIWLTGLSGSGKTTIAKHVANELHQNGFLTQILDGDSLRLGINNNLSFNLTDRLENVRRTAEVSKLFVQNGIITFCCMISPTIKIRTLARKIIGKNDFYETFVSTPLKECEKRDIKGLYKKARKSEIENFTGISSPYEVPKNPYITVSTTGKSIKETANELLTAVLPKIKF